jgi:4-amino-4-deoxy-L-arabinose transferase-like glycosyltransferase
VSRRTELLAVTSLLLVAVVLRVWDITRLPPGFSDNELAYIRITETVRQGEVAVHYQVGDGHGRAGMYGIINAVVVGLVGDGLLGYRLLAFWSSLLTLALLFVFTRRLFGATLALVALAFMTVNLRAILLARTATAETLVPLFVLLTLLALAAAFNLHEQVRFRVPDTLPFALLAILAGTSGYLHFTTLVLGPLSAVFFVHLLITRQPLSRRMWSSMVFVIVLATVVAVPYLISTLRHPDLSEPYIVWDQRPRSLADLVNGVLGAISGVVWRGDTRAAQNIPDAPLLGPVLALLFLAGLVVAVRRWREPAYGLVLLVLAAGLLTDAWVEPDTTFSANLVALPAVYILSALGVRALWQALRARERPVPGTPHAGQIAALIVLVILVANVITLRGRLFDRWRNDDDVALAYHANLGRLAAYLDREPDGPPISMCSADLNVPNAVGVTPRQALRLMMHREGLAIRHSDCQSGLVFVNAGAPMRFIFMNVADRALMPPELADWLRDAEPIPVRGLPEGTVLRLDVEQRIRDAGGFWESMALAFLLPDETHDSIPVDLPVPLEQNLTFAGYDPRVLEAQPVPGGDPVVLVTYWRVDGKLPPDLGIFAHLLAYPETDSRVPLLEPWAESNTIDVIPRELRNRDVFAQVSYLWLGDTVKPGEYALTVGAYVDTPSVLGNHLDVLADGQPRGDRLLLGTLRVQPAPPGGDGADG